MERRRFTVRLHAVLVTLALFMFTCVTGCASTTTMPKRPIPGGRSDATGLVYIVPVAPSRAYSATLYVLESAFPIAFSEKESKEKLERHSLYGEVVSKYAHGEVEGKKHRKKCNAFVHVIPSYPRYSKISVDCEHDVYEFGFARGGIHNLFTLWWDWYPEIRVYVAEDMLEQIREKLELKRDEVIRLSNLKVYELKDMVMEIQQYEAKKKHQ